jgi:uncharacterized protein (TIGR00369 family)
MTVTVSRLPESVAPDLLDRLRTKFAAYPLIQGWEVSVESVAVGRASMRLGGSPLVLNLLGTVNGGVQATLADMACAVALSTAFNGSMPFATSDLHIRYLEPASGPVLAEAEILRLSSRSAILECRLRCESRIVAVCTTHFTIKPRSKS